VFYVGCRELTGQKSHQNHAGDSGVSNFFIVKHKTTKAMETKPRTKITVAADVAAPADQVWNCWTAPEHIVKWCQASDDWHAPYADNDVRVDGKFKTTMAAKDGSVSFDFEGVYTLVVPHKKLAYVMSDGRRVSITFEKSGDSTHISETFEAEDVHPIDVQQAGWQAILDNFKKHTEAAR
jgi:uncharacterized protein YndB with AHSA1/START domain